MVKIFVNSLLQFNINDIESVYNLKEYIQNKTNVSIDEQTLYYAGTILKNNEPIINYKLSDGSNIIMQRSLNGGFDTLSLLFWLLYICVFLFFLVILVSGFMPIIAYTYEFILKWGIEKIIGSTNPYIASIITIILFIFSIGILYFFIYTSTAWITFPIFYGLTTDICKSVASSNSVGFWVSITFIIIYTIFNIPNIFLNLASKGSEANFFIRVFIKPLTGFLENITNIGKFAGIYAIPFIGTPFLSGYHFAVSLMTTLLKEGMDYTQMFSCADEQKMKELGKILRTAIKNKSPINDWIKSYNAEDIAEVIIIGLIPELYNGYKCEVDNMGFLEKFGETAGKFYAAKYATSGFCFALRIVGAISNVLNYMGGSSQIANIIRTGNVSGVVASIALFIALLYQVFINAFN